ncbi:MAG: hypothetical protein U5J99_03805 [Parvularculaceae bacterium]|nr:hypothetical protein [Parvularculaceae bacterium]
MSAESLVTAIGLGELFATDLLAVQLIVLAATVASFVVSLALMIMTGRSATGARRARAEAEGLLRSAQDFAVEARQLAAKVERIEKSASVAAAPESKAAAPATRVSARETTPEAEIEIISLKEQDRAARNLDAAKEAASVPSGLLGGFRPRRR